MKISLELRKIHLFFVLAIMGTSVISLAVGAALTQRPAETTTTITKTITSTIKEPITITGGYVIEPTIGLFMFGAVIIIGLILARSMS